MSACPVCGAEGATPGAGCTVCGAGAPGARGGPSAIPDLELDLPQRAPKAAPAPKKLVEEAAPLELAVDLRASDRDQMMFGGPLPTVGAPGRSLGGAPPPSARSNAMRYAPAAPTVGDVGFDAQLLADYGRAPDSLFSLPFYAWRVMRRQGELKSALEARRAEAERAKRETEDALVAFAGRARAALEADADKATEFAMLLIELRKAEDVLRSRDSVLASEQDAHSARLAAVAVRLMKLEAELAHAQAAERKLAIELATAQAALSREETKLKRVEAELRSAQRRPGGNGSATP